MKKKRIILVIIIGVVVVGALAATYWPRPNESHSNQAYNEVSPSIQSIQTTLKGNGTLEPADSYSVTALVSGEVLQANFEEGEVIEKDALLYVIDDSALSNAIEQAEMSLEQSQRNYNRSVNSLEDLRIKSKTAGVVTSLSIDLGDTVMANQVIATVRDQDHLTMKVPFIANEADSITIGQTATITLSQSFESVIGTVTEVGMLTTVGDHYVITKEVTIEVLNPGALTAGLEGYALVDGYAGTKAGVFEWKDETSILTQATGEVSEILVSEGDQVNSNQLLVVLTSETLSNTIVDSEYAIRSSQMSLDKQLESLEDYQIKSPIAGTIVEKNVKEGDTLSEIKSLCTIFDMSYLTTVLNIDELDISKVQVGSQVDITVEALEDAVFQGVISRININGNTLNGVTTYPVTVRIDETEGLLPGMNATFEVIVAQKENALVLPITAVERDNQVLVYTGTTVKEADDIPLGYEYLTVETGISDNAFVEILSGIEKTDRILIKEIVLDKDEIYFGPNNNSGGF